MAREVQDADGTTWSCVQAFTGLSEGSDREEAREKREAARVEDGRDRFHVVCTPTGGAKSVRVELPGGWEERLSDEALLEAIHRAQQQEG